MRLRLWAPRAQRVEVVLADGDRLAMTAVDQGWYELDSPLLAAGLQYRVSLDGGEAIPDPLSAFQPDGVEGPSQLVSDEFAWRDTGWTAPPLAEAIIYELHLGTFTPEGTFDAVIARLDHLVDLGVTAVELMPVAEFPGRWGWGYDGVDLFAVRAAYGGPDGLRRLVDACHRRGLAIILDVVYNHLGPAGNHLAELGPFFTDSYRTPWGQAVNFDGPGSDGVRELVIANALRWLGDFHLDGLRLDAVHAIHDESAKHIVEELAEAVDGLAAQLGRRLWLILETDRNDPRGVWPRDRGGWGAVAQWADDFHHALHSALTGEDRGYYSDFRGLADVVRALRSPHVYRGQHSAFRDRHHGRSAESITGDHFVVCIQNHDQVGNRARGERLSQLVGTDQLRIAALLLLTSPYVPLLFAGEEWGAGTPFLYFTDHEPGLGARVTAGRRQEFAGFGWNPEEVPDPQAEGTFVQSRLCWPERDQGEHRSLLDWYRALIRLRRSIPDLGCGDPGASRVDADVERDWLTVQRGGHVIAVNLGGEWVEIPGSADPGGELLLATGPGVEVSGATLRLPPFSGAVWGR
ncbi:MAG: malto-oligosyltrehalose trehalohydrolase [Candidatus Dormiibacterota bacterium]